MTRRERLMATLNGKPVDRPAVNFYEISGIQDVKNQDPFNIYSHPSWRPLIELAREKTDRIVMCNVPFKNVPLDPLSALTTYQTTYDASGSRHTVRSIRAGDRVLTERSRRDLDVNTVWTTEHLLKNVDDLKAWLSLPPQKFGGEPDISGLLRIEKELGDTGIVMIDTGDPLGFAAPLFDMGEYTIVAMTEQELFHKALERFNQILLPRIEAVAKALPGRLWRIWGPEYASPPYLPPYLFQEYVVKYNKPIVEAIQKYGGYARIHSHGRLKDILDDIVSTGCAATDPVEPPPQGDVELSYVRKHYGQQLVLFGNIEVSDLENLSTEKFSKKIETAIKQGSEGKGRGFVLMPSSCTYSRQLSSLTLKNYEKMVEMIERL